MNTTQYIVFFLLLPILLPSCVTVPKAVPETRPVVLPDEEDFAGKGFFHNDDQVSSLSFVPRKSRTEVVVIPADGELHLSIEQAVLSALLHNRSLLVEQFEPVIAGTFIDTERAVFDTVFSAEAGVTQDRNRSLDTATDRFFSIDGTETFIRAGVNKQFVTGTELSFDLSLQSDDYDNTHYADEASAELNLTQALLQGGSIASNIAAVQQAEVQALASAYNLRGFAENLVADVENSYWDYALALRQMEIFEESYEVARKQLEHVRTRIRVGQLAETDETVADAELALRRQQLIDARSEKETTRLALLRFINLPSSEGWDRSVRITVDTLVPEVNTGTALEHEMLAMKLRPELNEARFEVRSNELETVQTANGLLPRLDLFITLGKSGYSQSFGDSFSDLNGPGYTVAGGLSFEFPVGNRAAKALDLRARESYQQALQSVENLKQLIAMDVRNALIEVERSLKQIDASASRRKLQEEVVRSETVRFGVGTVTSLDVALVQRDLLESRIDEVEAIVHYRKALINLYLMDGTLLLRRGIDGPGAKEVVLSPQ